MASNCETCMNYEYDEEYECIDRENSSSPLYKDLPRDNNFLRNVMGTVCEWVSDAWNWVKGWWPF